MLKVKKARSEKAYAAMPLLNKPKKQSKPTTMLMPPYKPATSEYPISLVTVKPTALI